MQIVLYNYDYLFFFPVFAVFSLDFWAMPSIPNTGIAVLMMEGEISLTLHFLILFLFLLF